MAKKSAVEKQKRREKYVSINRERREELRNIVKSLTVSDDEKDQAKLALNKMRRDSSYTRLKNRCQLTGRPQGYLRKFCVSRICFRELASKGMIPGVIKASW